MAARQRLIVLFAIAACSRGGAGPVETPGSSSPARAAPQPPVDGGATAPPNAAVAPGARRVIAAARAHICVRTADARAACWGLYGSDLSGLVARPTIVPGVECIAGVAAGELESCAWTTAGEVWCWAHSGSDRAAHVIAGLDDVVEVASDDEMTCARRRGGQVECWAPDARSDNLAAAPRMLRAAPGLADAVEIAVARNLACARRKAGQVACWDGFQGAPGPIEAAAGATAIFGGSTNRSSTLAEPRFVALLPGGKRVGWRSTGTAWPLPALAADATQIAIGSDELCTLGHGVACWNIAKPGTTAHVLAGLDEAVEIAVGESVSCARLRGGKLACWGLPDRVGNGATFLQDTPVAVVGLTDAVQLSVGGAVCARRRSGAVACWGYRLVGDGVAVRPEDVAGLRDAADIAVGETYACARRAAGEVVCWGDQAEGRAARWPTPTVLPELARATALTVIDGHVCGQRDGKTVCPRHAKRKISDVERTWSVGFARESWTCAQHAGRKIACTRHIIERGGGETDEPVDDLGDLAGVVDFIPPRLHAGSDTAYVVRASGEVAYHGDRQAAGEFVPIAAGGAVTTILEAPAGGGNGTEMPEICGLVATGAVTCWTDPQRDTGEVKVHKIAGLTDVIQLVGSHSQQGMSALCALRKTGAVACWGVRELLGDGVGGGSDDPVVINGLAL